MQVITVGDSSDGDGDGGGGGGDGNGAVGVNLFESVGACCVVLLMSSCAPVDAAFFPLPCKYKRVVLSNVEITRPGVSVKV